MDGYEIDRLLRHDFSKGSDDFREDLLQRCLDALNVEDEGADVSDDALELLSAAGHTYTQDNPHTNLS